VCHINDVAGCSKVQAVPDSSAAEMMRRAASKHWLPKVSLAVIGARPHGKAIDRVELAHILIQELNVEQGGAK
jgi:hypothetical protein